MKILLTTQSRHPINHRWLLRHLRALLKLLKIETGHWSITLIDDHEMKALHKRTMNDPTTTDVLTFNLSDRKSELNLDTILCVDEAIRRGKEFNHPPTHELLLYALHSLLHVRGYDDRTPTESTRMHRREDALLIRLGVGPIYKPRRKLQP